MKARSQIFAAARAGRRAFTLIELMLAIAISTVIVGALYAVFNQTQRAMRSSNNQVDVLESGRAAMDLVTREIMQMSATRLAGYTNFVSGLVSSSQTGARVVARYYSVTNTATDLRGYQPVVQSLPAAGRFRTNSLQEVFWFSRNGNVATGTGLRVIDVQNGVGTLARVSLSVTNPVVRGIDFYPAIQGAPAASYARIADGIIHFRIQPYDSRGVPLSWQFVAPQTTNWYGSGVSLVADELPLETRATMRGTNLPAYLEVELAVLEPATFQQVKSMPSSAANSAAAKFLRNRAGQVHLFRQRVAVPEGICYPSYLPK